VLNSEKAVIRTIYLILFLIVILISGIHPVFADNTKFNTSTSSKNCQKTEQYNLNHAFTWSLAPTLLSIGISSGLFWLGSHNGNNGRIWAGAGVLSAGLSIGPSMGHFYSHNWRRGFITSGIRASLIGGWLVLSARMMKKSEGYNAISTVMISGGLGVAVSIAVIILAFQDILTAKRSAIKANQKTKKKVCLSVAPATIYLQRGNNAWGMQLLGKF